MRKKLLFVLIMYTCTHTVYAQEYVVRNENGSITAQFGVPSFGALLNTETLTYDKKNMGQYAIGWFWDSWNTGSPTFWLSSYGGMKFFCGQQPRLSITNSGNIGVGTEQPQAKFHIDSGKETDAIVLATTTENNKLVVRSEHTHLSNCPTFRIIHDFNNKRANGYINFHRGGSDDNGFLSFGSAGIERMRIDAYGNIGVGTTMPDYKLDVVGAVRAHQVLVNTQKGADFVFEEGYNLRSLEEVEQFISKNKHLPDIIPANTMIQEGVDMGELQILLLQKIEELTLYVINLEKKSNEQLSIICKLNEELQELKTNQNKF